MNGCCHMPPYTHGEITFGASNSNEEVAENLGVEQGIAVFEIERTTWDDTHAVTYVRQCFQPGYRMQTKL